jgi:hypothetical protein
MFTNASMNSRNDLTAAELGKKVIGDLLELKVSETFELALSCDVQSW